jgi:hypothetical protein
MKGMEMNKLATHILISLVLTLQAARGLAKQCADFNYSSSSAAERVSLLRRVQDELLVRSENSDRQLTSFIDLIEDCESTDCRAWLAQVIGIVREQYRVSKVAQAIAESGQNFFRNRHREVTIATIIDRVEAGQVQPQHVADFSVADGDFSEPDQVYAFNMWYRIFIAFANDPATAGARDAIRKTKQYFARVSQALVQTNVVLGFIRSERSLNPAELLTALRRIRDFNADFADRIENFRVEHRQGLLAKLAIFVRDHEMGLVDFLHVVGDVINSAEQSETYHRFCSARQDLLRQQRVRVRTSIGVGFGTAVLCGVGIWSGVGTIPAAALCAPALADGALGGARGALNTTLSHRALYAGRDYSEGLLDTEGVISFATQQAAMGRNRFVAAVNFLGMVPVGRALHAVRLRDAQQALLATTRQRGTVVDLVRVPSVDVTVSFSESQSYGVAFMLMAIRGVEWLSESDFVDMVRVAHSRHQ